jgi:hypothetical protein
VNLFVRILSVLVITASVGLISFRLYRYFAPAPAVPTAKASAEAARGIEFPVVGATGAALGVGPVSIPPDMRKVPLSAKPGSNFDFDVIASVRGDGAAMNGNGSHNVSAFPAGTIGIVYHFLDDRNYSFARLGAESASLGRVEGGVERTLAQTSCGIDAGKPHAVSLRRRGMATTLALDGRLAAAAYEEGQSGGDILVAGNADFRDQSFRPLDGSEVSWSDDFMRKPEDSEKSNDDWDCDRKQWRILTVPNPSRSENAFSFNGRGKGTLAAAGKSWWGRYTLKAALRGPEGGRMGLAFALTDQKNGYVFRWSAAKAAGAEGGPAGAHEIVKLEDGRERTLVTAPGGYLPNQWHQVTIHAGTGRADVSIDGRIELTVRDDGIVGGRIGLWADADNPDLVFLFKDQAPISGRVASFTPTAAVIMVNGDSKQLQRPNREEIAYIQYGGVTFDDVAVTPLERVADDFASDRFTLGGWQTLYGAWDGPVKDGGPEADALRAASGGAARALFGSKSWYDYRLAADVTAPADGARVGLVFNYRDESCYDAFILGREGARIVHFPAGRPDAVNPDVRIDAFPWKGRIEVVTDHGHVAAYVKGKLAVQTFDPEPRSGRVGATAENAPGTTFRRVEIDFLPPPPMVLSANAVFDEELTMKTFADTGVADWRLGTQAADNGAAAYYYKAVCHGDTQIEVEVDEKLPTAIPPGQLDTVRRNLFGDRTDLTAAEKSRLDAERERLMEALRGLYTQRKSDGEIPRPNTVERPRGVAALSLAKDIQPTVKDNGYVVRFSVPIRSEHRPAGDPLRDSQTPPMELRLVRDGAPCALTAADGTAAETLLTPMPSALDTVGLRQSGAFIIATVNGRAVGWFRDPAPKTGGQVAFFASGVEVDRSSVRVYNRNLRNNLFSEAPTDWRVGAGQWDISSRWQCDPRWSFMSGWYKGWPRPLERSAPQSTKMAAIWNKRPIDGDFSFECFVGPKMQTQMGSNYQYVRDFNISVCADGQDLTSGYVFSFGAANNAKTALYRKGELVAQSDRCIQKGDLHRKWIHLTVVRNGDTFRFYVLEDPKRPPDLVLEYKDPQPISGPGYCAVWSYRMGLMLSRVRIAADQILPARAPWEWAGADTIFRITGADAAAYDF